MTNARSNSMLDEVTAELRRRALTGRDDAATLASWVVSRLGPRPSIVQFDYCFWKGLDIPLRLMRDAEQWEGLHRGAGGWTDAEFSACLGPWLDALRGGPANMESQHEPPHR